MVGEGTQMLTSRRSYISPQTFRWAISWGLLLSARTQLYTAVPLQILHPWGCSLSEDAPILTTQGMGLLIMWFTRAAKKKSQGKLQHKVFLPTLWPQGLQARKHIQIQITICKSLTNLDPRDFRRGQILALCEKAASAYKVTGKCPVRLHILCPSKYTSFWLGNSCYYSWTACLIAE